MKKSFIIILAMAIAASLCAAPAMAAGYTPVLVFGNSNLNIPTGVASDSSGNIFVADRDNNLIQKFSSAGIFISQFGGSGSGNGLFSDPSGVAVDRSSGNIFVVDRNNNLIQKFSSAGVFVSQFGGAGAGSGLFNYPFGVAVDSSGNIFVADTNNNRIQVWAPTFDVTFSAGANGAVTGTSPQTVNKGSNCTAVAAAPSAGYAFLNWTGTGGFVTSTANLLTVSNVTADMTITANFQVAPPPVTASVTLTGISSITGSTVLATGNATGTGIGERGFYWWIPPTAATHFGGSESGLIPEGNYGAGSFSLTVTGLKPGNAYHLKAYVKVGGQIITSDEQLFTTATTGATGNMAPTVLTDTVNFTVSGSSITVSGEITDVGSSAVNVYGFIYAPHIAPYTGDDMPKNGDTAYAMWDKVPLYQGMKFTATVKNIPPGKWYLRSYAHNENPDSDAAQTASLSYGEDISFTIACTPETCIPGDVNGDGKISLDDAMLVLRILAGIPVGNVNLNADVNGDGKIGLEELGFILQKVAEVR